MTILFFTPSFYPEIGGVEKHVLEVAKIISRRHKVIIITESYKNSRENLKGIEIHRFNFGKKGWFKKFRIWKKLLIEKEIFRKADIVHCHDIFFWYFPLRFVFPTKKVYTTFHGHEGVFPPRFKDILIRKLSAKLSTGTINVGRYIEKWYGTKTDLVTYGAVSNSKNIKFYRSMRKKIKILFVGRIDEDNGIKIYANALSKIKNYEFIACGDGSLKSEFISYGKVLGFVKNPEYLIKKADIILASSYLSIILAMSLKKPVFSIYQNSLKKDYLKMTPFANWINIASSSDDLASKIKKFKRLRQVENIEKGYNWANEQTWQKVASLYFRLYKI